MRIWNDPLERKKDLTEGCRLFFLCGLCTAILAAFGLYRCGIYPGSENTLLCFDMAEQFVSFFASLRQIPGGEGSLFYSWSEALGGNYYGLYAYYLASPFSWLTCLWPLEKLPDAIYGICLLKLSLCAGTESLFLRCFLKKRKKWILFFSLCYSLSAAAVSFLFLPMYLDALIFLPLIALGIRRTILEERLSLLYPVSLCLCILTHYYSGFMICIFAGFYALHCLAESGFCRRKLLRFVWQSISAGMAAMPVLLPVLYDLSGGKGTDGGVYSDGSFLVVRPVSFLKSFLPGQYGSFLSDGAPEVFCGSICLLLAGYALYRNRKKPEGKTAAFLCILFLASFLCRPLYRIWHGFRDPVAYPHRFAFLWCFFLIQLAAAGLEDLRIPGVAGPSADQAKGSGEGTGRILHAAGPALLWILTAAGLLLTETSIVRGIYGEVNKIGRSEYVLFLETTMPVLAETRSLDAQGGRVFSRTEADFGLTSNDALMLGYRGITCFSSTYHGDLLKLLKSLGLLQYHYKTYHDGSTILTDSLFGIRYLLCKYPYPGGYAEGYSNGFAKLCINEDALDLGLRVPAPGTVPEGDFGPENQNLLAGELTGDAEQVFVPAPFQAGWERLPYAKWQEDVQKFDLDYGLQGSVTFTAQEAGDYYLAIRILPEEELTYEEKEAAGVISVTVNEVPMAAFTGYHRAYNVYLGSFDAGEAVQVLVDGADKEREMRLYRVDAENYQNLIRKIRGNAFHTVRLEDRHVSGDLPAGDGAFAVFTIPYDEGWHIYVNGRRVRQVPAFGALTAVPVPKEAVRISFSYWPRGLTAGLLSAFFGICIWTAAAVGERRIKRPDLKKEPQKRFQKHQNVVK